MSRPTSVEAYKPQFDGLTPMQQKVFSGVLRYKRLNERWPTAPELHCFLASVGSVEPNSCTKSRVTELKNPVYLPEEVRVPFLEEHQEIEKPNTVTDSWTVRPSLEVMQ